jgi:hypothetical protein
MKSDSFQKPHLWGFNSSQRHAQSLVVAEEDETVKTVSRISLSRRSTGSSPV